MTRRRVQTMRLTRWLGLGASGRARRQQRGSGAGVTEWRRRQARDPYVVGAQAEEYRARSAFKLVQMHERFRLLRPGLTALDCGCAPGSWSQVLVQGLNADAAEPRKAVGAVVGLDKAHSVAALPGATFLTGADVTEPSTKARVLAALHGAPLDLLLSDMAPQATGNRPLDQERMAELLRLFLRFGLPLLRPDRGVLVVKVLDGPETPLLRRRLEPLFAKLSRFKPHASRADSSEAYLVGQGFTGEALLD